MAAAILVGSSRSACVRFLRLVTRTAKVGKVTVPNDLPYESVLAADPVSALMTMGTMPNGRARFKKASYTWMRSWSAVWWTAQVISVFWLAMQLRLFNV